MNVTVEEGEYFLLVIINVLSSNMHFGRTYLISNGAQTYDSGNNFCAGKGMGLAVWNTAELYEDLKYMATTVKQEDLFTALSNENQRNCNTTNQQTDCDGKLVWRQTKNGPCELFNAHSGFTGYVAHMTSKQLILSTSNLSRQITAKSGQQCLKFKEDQGKVHKQHCSNQPLRVVCGRKKMTYQYITFRVHL